MYLSDFTRFTLRQSNVKSERPLIFILSGAGLSAESGIPTYRHKENNWRNPNVITASDLRVNPLAVFNNINQRIRIWSQAKPNAAHFAIANFKSRWKNKADVVHVTQNIDTLSEEAGEVGVFHLHGSFLTSRCTKCGTVFPRLGYYKEGNRCPACKSTGFSVRPNVVFYEEIPHGMDWIPEIVSRADVFLAVGTSCSVFPAAKFVRHARKHGCHNRILITQDIEIIPGLRNPIGHFNYFCRGTATELLPKVLDKVDRWLMALPENILDKKEDPF